MFRPFETQFSDLIERLSAHERLLKLYMTVNAEVEALEFYNRFEKWWADADSGNQAQYPNVLDASAEAERLEGKTLIISLSYSFTDANMLVVPREFVQGYAGVVVCT